MPKHIELSPEQFECPVLSPHQREYLITKARESARTLVETLRSSDSPIRWREAGDYKNVQMYKGMPRGPASRLAVGGEASDFRCGMTTIHSTIEEIAAYFDYSTTDKLKACVATQDDGVDGVVLYTLVDPRENTNPLHQVTIQWSAVRLPSGLFRPRDFLTLECQDSFTDKTGRRGWVRSYHSIRLPCCPDLYDALGYVRGTIHHSGYVFVETSTPGVLKCITSLQVDLKGNLKLPTSVLDRFLKRRIGVIGDLDQKLLERRLAQPPDRVLRATRCRQCAASFTVFRRRTQCHNCGDAVCNPCTQQWTTQDSSRHVRLCFECVIMTNHRVHPKPSLDHESSYLSTIPILDNRPLRNHRWSRASPQYQHAVQMSTKRIQTRELNKHNNGSDDGHHLLYDTAPIRMQVTEPRPAPETKVTIKLDTLPVTKRPATMQLYDTDRTIVGSWSSSLGEHESISFCESTDGFVAMIQSKRERHGPSRDDPAKLYQRIIALTKQQTSNDSSQTQRIEEELRVLYERLDKAMEPYALDEDEEIV